MFLHRLRVKLYTDVEILVIQTMVMRLTTKEALAWLSAHGEEMGDSNYFKIKASINARSERRKFDLISNGLFEQHLERIDQLETILKLSWENYHRETVPFRKQKILESISTLQPLLSKYYEASQIIIEHDAKRLVSRKYLPKFIPTENSQQVFSF